MDEGGGGWRVWRRVEEGRGGWRKAEGLFSAFHNHFPLFHKHLNIC